MEEGRRQATSTQLEQKLSQSIQELYREQLGHQPEEISCQLSDRTLLIVVNNPITHLERLLVSNGKQEFAELLRFNLHQALRPQLQAVIEKVSGVNVTELLGESKLQSGNTTLVATLASTPKTEN